MRRYVHNEEIPGGYEKDVKKLREFIVNEMGIEISLVDTYKFWSAVSDSWCASWLTITTHYEDMTRAEFIEYKMEQFGYIINC